MRFEYIRLVVVYFMEVNGHVSSGRIGGRSFNLLDTSPFRQIGNVPGDILPMLATVARHLHQPIIGSHPYDLGIKGRDRKRENAAKGLGATDVILDGAAAGELLAFVIAGQIRANGRPVRRGVCRLKQDVAAQIDFLSVSVGDSNRRGPIKTIL